jgi:plastocyanin
MRLAAVLGVVIAIATAVVVAGPASARTAKAPSVVKVSALADGLKFNKTTLHAHAGKVKLVFTNLSTIDHNVRIESGENELGGTKTIGKGRTAAVVTLRKGTYNFYCSVAGHEDAGMRGTLIVS